MLCYLISLVKVNAQSCLNCSTTTGINNGLIFCTTMTGNADDGTISPVIPTLTGTIVATTDRYNASNSAYDFTTSASTRITYTSSSKLDIATSQSFTMSAWFYQRSLTANPSYIASLGSSNSSNYSLLVNSSGNLVFNDYYGPGLISRVMLASTNVVSLNTWNHLAITINKTTGLHTLYLNGISIGTITSTNSSALTGSKVFIGNNSVNDWGMNGKIDDVRIYNRALSSADIGILYTSTIALSIATKNWNICKGDSVTLDAGTSSASSYAWSPSSGLNDATLIKPVSKPLTTTKYYINVQTGGCSATDSVTVKIDTINLSAPDKNVCVGNAISLSATGATSYVWTPTTGLSNPNISNPAIASAKTAIYTVKGIQGACTSYDTVVVTACSCIPVYDTVKVTQTIRDTIHTNVTDTTHILIRDTMTTHLTVTDTAHITIKDTVVITIRDTVTTHKTIMDTMHVVIKDTMHVVIRDTMHIVIRDTVPIGVTDTLYINIVKTGLNLPNDILNTLKVYPNPASDEVVIDNGNYTQIPNYSVRIVNITGQVVFTSLINRQTFRIQTNTLGSAGVYFVQILNNNNAVIQTKKLVLR